MANKLERRPKRSTAAPDADLLAEWNRRLKQADASLMTPTEEEQGVQYGSEGGEVSSLLSNLMMTSVLQKLLKRLRVSRVTSYGRCHLI